MTLAILLAMPMMLAPPVAPAKVFADPISDIQLSDVVGTGSPTTRLSLLVGEQGSAQGQWLGEDQRAGLANWFADNNVQMLANTALRND